MVGRSLLLVCLVVCWSPSHCQGHIEEIRNWFKDTETKKSRYDRYELFRRVEDDRQVLVPEGVPTLCCPYDGEFESVYLYQGDSLVSSAEIGTYFYYNGDNLVLIEENSGDPVEGAEGTLRAFYVRDGKLYFYFMSHGTTNYWVEGPECCPTKQEEVRCYFWEGKLIRALEKIKTEEDNRSMDEIPNEPMMDNVDTDIIFNMFNNFLKIEKWGE